MIIDAAQGCPVHPGEILREEFFSPLELTARTAARMLGVSPARVERLATETGRVTPDIALRLARLFGTTPQFWMSLQTRYDLTIAEPKALGLDEIHPLQNGT